VFFADSGHAANFYRSVLRPSRLAALGGAAGARRIGLSRWKPRLAAVPGDIRWHGMAVPGHFRRARNCCIQVVVCLVLLALTSPMAVLTALQTASAEQFDTKFDDSVTAALQWVQRLSPTASHALLQYIPTLVIVAINSVLLFVLHGAGRYAESPLSGVRREISILTPSYMYAPVLWFRFWWTAAAVSVDVHMCSPRLHVVGFVLNAPLGWSPALHYWGVFSYLTFNTLVVPTLVLGSVSALVKLVYTSQNALEIAGKLVLDNSGGVFFMAYMLQRIFIGGLAQMYVPVAGLGGACLMCVPWLRPRGFPS